MQAFKERYGVSRRRCYLEASACYCPTPFEQPPSQSRSSAFYDMLGPMKLTWSPLVAALCGLLLGCSRNAAKNPSPGADSQAVVAIVNNKPITLDEVDKAAGRELYELREKVLDGIITDRVVSNAAKAAGLPVNEYIRREAESRVPAIPEDQARAWFEQNKARLPEGLAQKSFDELKPMVMQALTEEKRRDTAQTIVAELKARNGVKVLLRPPRVEVAADGPSRGPDKAKVTIVEFSDFQCPYCSRGRQVIDEVVKRYGNKVRVVFRDFPLDFHDKAQKAAEAGHCANDQGKFWEMHDWMFDNQDKLDPEALKAEARRLGLDGNKFDQCLSSGQHAEEVKRHMREGQKAGVSGTPAFFINGVLLSGAQPIDKFKAEIDRALEE